MSNTGRPPNLRQCPTCGRSMPWYALGRFMILARHHREGSKVFCRGMAPPKKARAA